MEGSAGTYLVVGEPVESSELLKEMKEYIGSGEILLRIPEETLLSFLASHPIGSEVLKQAYERKRS